MADSLDIPTEIIPLFIAVIISMVDNRDVVAWKITQKTNGKLLQVRVARADLGKMIGKQGRVARSLRIVLKAMSSTCSPITLDLDAIDVAWAD